MSFIFNIATGIQGRHFNNTATRTDFQCPELAFAWPFYTRKVNFNGIEWDGIFPPRIMNYGFGQKKEGSATRLSPYALPSFDLLLL